MDIVRNEKITLAQREQVIEALDNDPVLARKIVAMVEASRSSTLDSQSGVTLPKVPDLHTDVAASEAPAILRKTPFRLAEQILWSYSFSTETGVSTFTLPVGVTDGLAMKVLNHYFRATLPRFGRDAVDPKLIAWCEALPQQILKQVVPRDPSQERVVSIRAVVKESFGSGRSEQEQILNEIGLIFADPRDQVLAAALHACAHQGADLFCSAFVRGSVAGYALRCEPRMGVALERCSDGDSTIVDISTVRHIAASGAPRLA